MKTLLEKKVLLSDLNSLFNKSERHILSFMNSDELELLSKYIPLFDKVTKIDLKLGNITNNKNSLPSFDVKSGMYVPTLKSILESYNDWKLIYSFDIFDPNDNETYIDFAKVRKNLQKSKNPMLATKLDIKISMWEKEKALSRAIDNATRKMFLNMSLKNMINKNRLSIKLKK